MRTALSFCAGPAGALAVPPSTSTSDRGHDPLLASLHVARAAMERGDDALALAAFERACLLAPRHPLALLGRTVCLVRMGRADEAVAILAAGAPPATLLHLARACVRDGEGVLAAELVRVALHEEPSLAASLQQDPAFASLRDHPLFLQMAGAL